MISVLIVDDEVLCAEGVKCSTDWNALEVDQVYTAYSMKQAMKVLEEHEVDIPMWKCPKELDWICWNGFVSRE